MGLSNLDILSSIERWTACSKYLHPNYTLLITRRRLSQREVAASYDRHEGGLVAWLLRQHFTTGCYFVQLTFEPDVIITHNIHLRVVCLLCIFISGNMLFTNVWYDIDLNLDIQLLNFYSFKYLTYCNLTALSFRL